ncbi:hypothetical protein [Arsenicibacter rosenii]|nr:hypothetical protein [Arsenicibacter rosenii]
MKKFLVLLFLVAAASACEQTQTAVDPVTNEAYGDTNHLGGGRPR